MAASVRRRLSEDGDTGNNLTAFEKREIRRNIRKLQDAITDNKIDIVQEIVSENINVDFYYRGQTALQLAVRIGHFEICRLLIAKGADVNKSDSDMNSLLNTACWRGYSDIAQLLIDSKADLDQSNQDGCSPLNACAVKGHMDMLVSLVKAGCDCDKINSKGQTALHSAIQQRNTSIIEILLKSGCDINQSDHSYRSPLIVAAAHDVLDAVKMLIAAGCELNNQDRLRQTALFHAASQGHLEVCRTLIEAGADINLPTTKGITPLLDSIRNNHVEVAKMLIESGCDINQKDRLHHAPIHEAIRQVSQYFGAKEPSTSSVSIVKLLVFGGADLNICDGEGWTPLYQAAYSGDLEITRLLLNNGGSVSCATNAGDSILHGGVYGNNPDIVDLLISTGCDVNKVNALGHHSLMAAVVTRANIKIVQSLITAGSDMNLPETKEQMSPLHEAIHHHHREAALFLIDSGCNLNCVNSSKQTALHNASVKGKVDIVGRLLKQPKLNKHGCSPVALPLHGAAVSGHVQVVQMLIEAGININQLNDGGLTALQAAIRENKYPVSKTLLQCGCDIDAHAKIDHLMKCCLLQDDAHPHFSLEPLFLAMTHKNTDLMRLLIQCYLEIPYRVVKMLSVILRGSQELRHHYSLQNKTDFHEIFSQAMKWPRSLQEICRCNIRALLGSMPQTKVLSLPIANKLKNYIAMTEVFLTLEEQERLEEEQLDQNGFVTG